MAARSGRPGLDMGGSRGWRRAAREMGPPPRKGTRGRRPLGRAPSGRADGQSRECNAAGGAGDGRRDTRKGRGCPPWPTCRVIQETYWKSVALSTSIRRNDLRNYLGMLLKLRSYNLRRRQSIMPGGGGDYFCRARRRRERGRGDTLALAREEGPAPRPAGGRSPPDHPPHARGRLGAGLCAAATHDSPKRGWSGGSPSGRVRAAARFGREPEVRAAQRTAAIDLPPLL